MIPAHVIRLYRPEYVSIRHIQCSPPSWMVELALEEKGLSYVVERLSFDKGEHRTPEMLARNPRGTIPVFTDGDAVLWESLAILEYLDLMYPSPPLLGEDGPSRARALNRLHESAALKRAGMALFAYIMRAPETGPDGRIDPAPVESLREAMWAELGWWDRYYGESTWAAGASLTMADLCVFVYVATAVRLGLCLTPAFPRLHAMVERMRARAAVQLTWPTPWRGQPPSDLLAP